MENITIPLLSGGLNEIVNPKYLPDGVNSQSVNYESETIGFVSLRKDTKRLTDAFRTYIRFPYMIWAWIPKVYPKEHLKEKRNYVLVIYDKLQRLLYMLKYTTDANGIDAWESVIDNDMPIFDNYAPPRIAESIDGLVLCDGRDNNVIRFINILQNGDITYGDVAIASPRNKAQVSVTPTRVSNESIDLGTEVPAGAALFYTYTLVAKDGSESAHAPVTVYDGDMYQRRDAESEITEYYNTIVVSNISKDATSVSGYPTSELKYINIYRAYSMYSQGITARSDFRFCKRIPIDSLGFTDSSKTEGNLLSEVQVEQIKADDITEAGGVVFLANTNTRVDFPYEFSRFMPIVITNENAINYVNKVFRFNLKDTDFKGENDDKVYIDNVDDAEVELKIDNILVNPLIDSTIKVSYLPRLRIYDNDLQTPLDVGYRIIKRTQQSTPTLCIWVKIPYLPANSEYTIYFCVADGKSAAGVNYPTDVDPNTLPGAFSTTLPSFGDDPLRNEQSVISVKTDLRNAPNLNIRRDDSEEIEGVDDEIELTAPAGTVRVDMKGLSLYGTDTDIEGLELITTGDDETLRHIKYTQMKDNDIVTMHMGSLMLLSAYVELNTAEYQDSESKHVNCLFSFRRQINTTKYAVWFSVKKESGEYYIAYRTARGGDAVSWQSTKPLPVNDSIMKFFLTVTYNKEQNKFSIYIIDIETKQILSEDTTYYIDYEHSKKRPFDEYDNFFIGAFTTTAKYNSPKSYSNMRFAHVNVMRDYLPNSEYSKLRLMHMAAFLPDFPSSWIGYANTNDYTSLTVYKDDNAINNNIVFEKFRSNVFDKKSGTLKWSSIGKNMFPATNQLENNAMILRVIPAPNYLHNGEYMNSVLIFGANGERKRLLLRGSPEGWQSMLSDTLVRELASYGLIHRNALIMVGDTIYWISPTGLMSENVEGIKQLSRDIIELPEFTNPTISYVPKSNQLLIYDGVQVAGIDTTPEILGGEYSIYNDIGIIGTSGNASRIYPYQNVILENREV